MGWSEGDPRVAVVGAGAIGGITAAFLARAGWDLELAAKHQAIVDQAAGEGLKVSGVRGQSLTRVAAKASIADLSGPKDVVLLATKAPDMLRAARELLPLLHQDSVVVSLQNGICEEALADVLGSKRVLGCVVGFGATMSGMGELELTSEGEFVVGELDGSESERLEMIRGMLSAVMPTRASRNIMGELYGKLIVNACINSLGALTGQKLGRLLAQKQVRRVFLGIMREAMAVAAEMGLQVEPGGGGKLDYYAFLDSDSPLADFRRHLMIRLIGFKYRRLKSSTLQSLERGRPSEIHALNGYIRAKGGETGVPTPVNDRIVAMVSEIEAGSRPISPENLADPLLAAC